MGWITVGDYILGDCTIGSGHMNCLTGNNYDTVGPAYRPCLDLSGNTANPITM